MTEFTQVYLRPKTILLGSSLAFSLKEDPVRCAKSVRQKLGHTMEATVKCKTANLTSFLGRFSDSPDENIPIPKKYINPEFSCIGLKSRHWA